MLLRLSLLLLSAIAFAAKVPSIDDLIQVRTIGGTAISPDGKYVAYTVSETSFEQDAFVTHIWLVNTATGEKLQVTRGEKSCTSPRWSPDGRWLSFTSDRSGGKSQIHVIRPDGGEAVALTKAETAVGGYEWSKDGKTIAFTAPEPAPKPAKERKETLGDFEVVRGDYTHSHLWTLDVAEAMKAPVAGKQRTKGKTFHVSGFSLSPDGGRIAFSASVNPDLTKGETSDIYVLTLADDSVKKIVAQPGGDFGPDWSPDGSRIVFSSVMGKTGSAAYNSRLAIVPAEGGAPRSLTDSFDESPSFQSWRGGAIYFSALQKTASHLFRLDPASGAIQRVSGPDALMLGGVSFTADGRRMAFMAPSPETLSELYVSDVASFSPRKLTDMTVQVRDWTLGRREVISWKSQDGAVIEGVLIKPANFDPSKKYPLLCIIHGGPTGIDRPTLLDARYYPADIWTARGALVLKVNYRGSAGYGEKFRRLNIRNLGVGDAWDVISGVDHLVAKGWVDPARVGCMGWSQGGYISAFLTTSSDRFRAISVGAGISDWATYYYNTDITHFTRNYLGADPVADPEIYRQTSPVAYVKNAKTPTLIQHGELDKRVPIANGYQLRQALEDRGVKAEMIVYKGFGHGITKPKSMRAVMRHNVAWFNHYIFGDPLPNFAEYESKSSEPTSGQ